MSEAPRPTFRFAPSPNGRLHVGHAYSALLNEAMASRLSGRLLLRIEDIDPVRSRPELIAAIAADLAWLGIAFEEPVRRQSQHMATYRAALEGLAARGLAYPCFCSRSRIAAAVAPDAPRDPDGVPLYPGTCRRLVPEEAARRIATGEPHSWRLAMDRALAAAPGPHGYAAVDVGRITRDRRGQDALPSSLREGTEAGGAARGTAPLDPAPPPPPTPPRKGEESVRGIEGDEPGSVSVRRVPADPSRWGDALIARRDVPTSYHLAVVLDDAAQGVTHVVRGQDLEAATDLHVLLQALLDLPSPAYHHHALLLSPEGDKLAKSKGSESLADQRAQGLTARDIRARLGFS